MLEFLGSISPCNLLFDRFRYRRDEPFLVKLRGIVLENLLLERFAILRVRSNEVRLAKQSRKEPSSLLLLKDRTCKLMLNNR
jgi:hypothetical protein